MKNGHDRRLLLPVFLITALLGHPDPALSQREVEIAACAGYQFWGGVDGIRPDGTPIEVNIEDAANWGGTIGYRAESNILFEISYLNQATTITSTESRTGIKSDLFDATVQYIQAGAMYEAARSGERFVPFGGITVGVVNFNPDVAGYSSEWRLSFGLNGGLKVYLSDRFGLRGQASLLFPIQWASGGMFCGSGGCTVGLSGGTVIVQGAATGGVFVEF